MKYKEFRDWCNDRAADGCWNMENAICCISIIELIEEERFWKREKKWQELNEKYSIVETIVNPINDLISKRTN